MPSSEAASLMEEHGGRLTMEHDAWVGASYLAGLEGQRVAIAGYSHHEDDADYAELTKVTVQKVIEGARYAFFTRIADAFGSTNATRFWNSVCFFNFLPSKIGSSDEKFRRAAKERHEAGRERLLKLLSTYEPHKLIAFTTKGFDEFPPYSGRLASGGSPFPANVPIRSWGSYKAVSGFETLAFGLRHPQGAVSLGMRAAVRAAMAVPIERSHQHR